MGKDTKDMLKTVIANQELMMKHFKISQHAASVKDRPKGKSVLAKKSVAKKVSTQKTK